MDEEQKESPTLLTSGPQPSEIGTAARYLSDEAVEAVARAFEWADESRRDAGRD